MKPSLSVIVPLYNAQTSLKAHIEELLEVLPELTPRFEVVLVDDGSTDGTRDVAHELSMSYPQVQVVIQPQRRGAASSVYAGQRYSHGELLLICSERIGFDFHEVHKVWDRRTDDGAVVARCGGNGVLGSIPRHPAAPLAGEGPSPDLLLVPRRLLTGRLASGDGNNVLVHLRALGYPLSVVEIRARRSPRRLAPRPKMPVRTSVALGEVSIRPDVVEARPTASVVRRPNLLLSKLRSSLRG